MDIQCGHFCSATGEIYLSFCSTLSNSSWTWCEVNFYEDKYDWSFIGSFFLLHLYVLIMNHIVTYFKSIRGESFITGKIAVLWLYSSWISTIVLSAPILGAVLGNSMKGVSYGILTAISSFLSQLPLKLVFFEYHKVKIINMINNDSNFETIDTVINKSQMYSTMRIRHQIPKCIHQQEDID